MKHITYTNYLINKIYTRINRSWHTKLDSGKYKSIHTSLLSTIHLQFGHALVGLLFRLTLSISYASLLIFMEILWPSTNHYDLQSTKYYLHCTIRKHSINKTKYPFSTTKNNQTMLFGSCSSLWLKVGCFYPYALEKRMLA